MATKKEKITFENSVSQLDDILEKMSSDETGLEESITLYAKAADLIAQCNTMLAKASVQVEEINSILSNQQP